MSAQLPTAYKTRRVDVSVGVQVLVAPDGKVADVMVLSPSVEPDLAAAVVDAVRRWEYKPNTFRGVPIYSIQFSAVRFKSAPER